MDSEKRNHDSTRQEEVTTLSQDPRSPGPVVQISELPNTRAAELLQHLKNHWKVLLLGQVLSFLLASAGAAQATLHLECGLNAPTFTMSVVYFFLSFHLIISFWRGRRIKKRTLVEESDGLELTIKNRQGDGNSDDSSDLVECHSVQQHWNHSFLGLIPLKVPAWKYFIIAFLDIEANAITMLSFRYTTLTSVTLLDALAVPSAMFFSRCFFRRQYVWLHFLGVIICMTGVVFNVMQDYEFNHSSQYDDANFESREYPNKLRGDLLAVTGGLLYGLSDTLTEVLLRYNGNRTEYLGMMGLFAFIIAVVQSVLFERDKILDFFRYNTKDDSACSMGMQWWMLFIFVGVTFLSYIGASQFLILSDAAFFNLSLLTGDLWSVLFSVVAEKIVPQPFFFVALIFVLSGVSIYEMAPSPVVSNNNNYDVPTALVHDDASDDE